MAVVPGGAGALTNPAEHDQVGEVPEPEGTRQRALSDRQIANLFLLPTILLLVGMNLFPLFWSLILSFNKYKADEKAAPVWIGNANYQKMLANPDVWQSFQTTAGFVVLAVGA